MFQRYRALVFAVSLGFATQAGAVSINVDAFGDPWEVYNFRASAGTSSWGGAYDAISFGINNVVPNAKNGTTATATQNGVSVDLVDGSSTTNPNAMYGSIGYDPILTGSWQITLKNSSDSLVVTAPAIGSAGFQNPVTSLSQSSGGKTPTFSWTNPNPNQNNSVSIYDLQSRNSATGVPDRIFVNGLGLNATSFSVPSGLLKDNHLYAIGIENGILRGAGTNPSGSSQANAYLAAHTTFFDFSTGALPPGAGEVYLPVVDVTSGTPIFNFNNPVLAGLIQYYDPLVAIGYDFSVGVGNPFFNSVILPDLGDGVFDLFFYDGSQYQYSNAILAGQEYFFGAGGVSDFRIMGIETTAGLDPNDPNAFVTGLSFVSDGQFTGTMTPISVDTDTLTPVPLPGSLALLLAGFLGLVWSGRRRKITIEH